MSLSSSETDALYPNFRFEVTHRDPATKARCGLLHTPHGVIETPNFIFCATKAAIKGATIDQVKAAGAQIILSNTYHLLLQPGPDLVARHGGLHQMIGWDGPMLTDSGGFQIFSLGHGSVAEEIKGNRQTELPRTLIRIDEDGAVFRSYLDGAIHQLTPELSIEAQRKLGADFIVVLDECTPFRSDRDYTARAMRRSHRWESRSLQAFCDTEETLGGGKRRQALYGIVQGGVHEDLREESASYVASQPFFGQAVGGTLGGTREQMKEVVHYACTHLHPNRPTHLLGIGGLTDLWMGVTEGIDTFDCVHPTRIARHGGALVRPEQWEKREHFNLKNARFREDLAPIDETCDCYTCRHFTRAYLHHLIKAGESAAGTLLTIHNIAFMARLAAEIRQAIRDQQFNQMAQNWMR